LELKDQIAALPSNPGVYQYFDSSGKIIYVGKAKNLKNRVSSYFVKHQDSAKTRILVRQIAEIKYIVVGSELDALLLENSLIKEHQPKYNIQLKDDKTYPWICIKKEPFPRVFSTRNVIKDGSEYYGPYASVKMMRTILDLIKQLYPLRNCNFALTKENIEAKKFKVCLEYHIGNCLGGCVGKETEEDYNKKIDEIRHIIKGNINGVIKNLYQKLDEYTAELAFEKCQLIKEKIESLENYQAKSAVVSPTINDVDVLGFTSDIKSAYVNFLKVVNGAIVQGYTVELKKKLDESDAHILQYALFELREKFKSTSKEILVPFLPELFPENTECKVPQKGDKKLLLDLAERNAKYFMLDKHKQDSVKNPEQICRAHFNHHSKRFSLKRIACTHGMF
jgi:excinuclease ABC subunit C